MISVAIVEPYPVIAKGIEQTLRDLKTFEIATVVTEHCQFFLERVLSSHPDILIINPMMLDLKKRARVEELIELTGCHRVVALQSGFLEIEVARRYHAVIDIANTPERIASKLRKLVETELSEPENNELSSREQEILVCVAKGMMNKEIAEKHKLSIHTVITHRKNIARKTGIKSVSGLTVFAILNNLIGIEEIE